MIVSDVVKSLYTVFSACASLLGEEISSAVGSSSSKLLEKTGALANQHFALPSKAAITSLRR